MDERTQPNPNNAETRQLVIKAGVACFRRLGYSTVALPDIAAEAGLPLAAVKRHYASKEAIARTLVQAKIDELVDQIDALPAGAMADRYSQALTFAVQTLSQDREAVAAVFADAMVDGAEFDLMSGSSAQRLTAAMERLVLASNDALREQQARDMSAALYAAFIFVLLFWCYDRSPGQAATDNLLSLARDLFAQLRPLYFLPMTPGAIARLASIVQPQSESVSVGAAAQDDARDGEHQDFDVHRD